MNNLTAVLIFVIISVSVVFTIIFWAACVLGKRTDKQTEDAFIKMMENQSNITSGSAVIKE